MFNPGDKIKAKVSTQVYKAGDEFTVKRVHNNILEVAENSTWVLTPTNFELVPGIQIPNPYASPIIGRFSELDLKELNKKCPILVCECGASAVKSPMHSNWCALAKKDNV